MKNQQASHRKRKPVRRSGTSVVAAVAVLLVVVGAAVALASVERGGRVPTSNTPAATPVVPQQLQAVAIEVTPPVADLGRVPLDTPVRQEWVLRNTGSQPVSLGRAKIEVLEGC